MEEEEAAAREQEGNDDDEEEEEEGETRDGVLRGQCQIGSRCKESLQQRTTAIPFQGKK